VSRPRRTALEAHACDAGLDGHALERLAPLIGGGHRAGVRREAHVAHLRRRGRLVEKAAAGAVQGCGWIGWCLGARARLMHALPMGKQRENNNCAHCMCCP